MRKYSLRGQASDIAPIMSERRINGKESEVELTVNARRHLLLRSEEVLEARSRANS
jgi:hypothetical protein